MSSKAGYQGFEAQWHDLFWEAEDDANELPLLKKFLDFHPGKALYVGSGSGRLLAPLLEEGYDLVGLEPSQEMNALCREKCKEAILIESSWEEANFTEEFTSIVIPAFTLQLFSDPHGELRKMREMVDHVYVSLFFPWMEMSGDYAPGTWFPDLELPLEDGKSGKLETKFQLNEDKETLKRQHRYRLYGSNGDILKEEQSTENIRWFSDKSLTRLLKKTGFQIAEEVTNFGGEGEVAYVTTLFLEARS